MIDFHKKIKTILFAIKMITKESFEKDSFDGNDIKMWQFYCTSNSKLAKFSRMLPNEEQYPLEVKSYIDTLYSVVIPEESDDNDNDDLEYDDEETVTDTINDIGENEESVNKDNVVKVVSKKAKRKIKKKAKK